MTKTRVTADHKRIINNDRTVDCNQLVPIKYKWAWSYYLDGCANSWMPTEVNMQRDIEQWKDPKAFTPEERHVIKRVFGQRAYDLPVSSIKSTVGHMQGACGSAEMAACCLAIRDSVLPPTANLEYPDPECDLDYVPNVARRRRVDIAASNSFSFGGRNTAIILRRYQNGHVEHLSTGNGNGNGHG